MNVDDMSAPVIERLHSAINRHDIDALMDCFEPDVRNELPTRPERGFRGREELRGYWEQIIGDEGQLRAKLLRCTRADDIAWAEWCWHGERADGLAVRPRRRHDLRPARRAHRLDAPLHGAGRGRSGHRRQLDHAGAHERLSAGR